MVPPDLWAPFPPQTRPTRAPAGAIGGLTWGIMWRDGIRSTRWNQPQDPRAARVLYLHITAHLTVLVQRTLISIPVNNLLVDFGGRLETR